MWTTPACRERESAPDAPTPPTLPTHSQQWLRLPWHKNHNTKQTTHTHGILTEAAAAGPRSFENRRVPLASFIARCAQLKRCPHSTLPEIAAQLLHSTNNPAARSYQWPSSMYCMRSTVTAGPWPESSALREASEATLYTAPNSCPWELMRGMACTAQHSTAQQHNEQCYFRTKQLPLGVDAGNGLHSTAHHSSTTNSILFKPGCKQVLGLPNFQFT
jgi:hypothetical protein